MNEKSKFPDKFTSGQFVKYIDHTEIKGLIGSLGHAINQKYCNEELVLVAVLKGCITFMADLVREIKNVKLKTEFVKISVSKPTEKNSNHSGTIILGHDIEIDIFDKHVLILSDIIDSGRRIHFLKKRLMLAAPKSCEIITLFDKPYKRAIPLNADLIGKKIDDQFIIGAGLDLEDFGRNLKDIYFLKYPQ